MAERLIFNSRDATVVIVDADAVEPTPAAIRPPPPSDYPAAVATASPPSIFSNLSEGHVAIYREPVAYDAVLRDLVGRIAKGNPAVKIDSTLQKLLQREAEGSTALNSGISLPHARLDEIDSPQIALALTRDGVVNGAAGTQAVFLLLTPSRNAAMHLKSLAAISRTLQRHDVRALLGRAADAKTVVAELRQMR